MWFAIVFNFPVPSRDRETEYKGKGAIEGFLPQLWSGSPENDCIILANCSIRSKFVA